ncbi:MAG: hypothetical protein CK548_01315 [Opitutia bacterium]|nr:hypothetical protein [Opitutaceae bacterium]PHX73391.1 MAG: hypothetical protein CK548_01315 [Opitutae bacterium]
MPRPVSPLPLSPSLFRPLFFTFTLLLTPAVHALSVIAPTFPQLVAASDTIARGTVTAIRSEEFDSAQGRGVRTLVTLRLERILKGTPAETITLTLLGGTVGKRTLRVVGLPTFIVGQRQIIFFANNGTVLCPLVAAGHGRYHVLTDPATQRDYVTRDNLAPLSSTDEIALPLATPAVATITARLTSPADALTLAAFETQITAALDSSAPAVRLP